MIGNGVLALTETQAEILELVIFVGVWLVGLIVVTWIQNATVRKRLILLDWILDEPDKMDGIASVGSYVNLCIEGFRVAHPLCINWNFPGWAIETWPEHEMAWFVYAKFVAIFPEQSQLLSWIYRTIVANQIRGRSARTVKTQALIIARQRESNLSPGLKNKMKHLSKLLAQAKHKLRRVWDLAIQGNITDMDEASRRAMAAIEQCDASMRHISLEFPNNRFVAR
jgi:hypothetical protein